MRRGYSRDSGGLIPGLFVKGISEDLSDSFPPDALPYIEPPPVQVPRPVYHKGFSPQFSFVEKTPFAAVRTIVAVIAHDKKVALGNNTRAVIFPGSGRPLKDGIGFFERPVIDVDLIIDNLDLFSGKTYQPFHKILSFVAREFKDDDIASLRFFEFIDEFIHQNLVSDKKGVEH